MGEVRRNNSGSLVHCPPPNAARGDCNMDPRFIHDVILFSSVQIRQGERTHIVGSRLLEQHGVPERTEPEDYRWDPLETVNLGFIWQNPAIQETLPVGYVYLDFPRIYLRSHCDAKSNDPTQVDFTQADAP